MAWDGVDRRQHDCIQLKRLDKVELTMDGTIKELADQRLLLMEIKTILTGKIGTYDAHIESGERWRSDMFKMLIAAVSAGMASTVGFGIWVGSLANQIQTNTKYIENHSQHVSESLVSVVK